MKGKTFPFHCVDLGDQPNATVSCVKKEPVRKAPRDLTHVTISWEVVSYLFLVDIRVATTALLSTTIAISFLEKNVSTQY